jgi:hypothetical protein
MDELQLLISDDLDKVASLEAEMLDVATALEDLAAQDGVSRTNMASFETYLPEDYPLASFTKNPTHTNLSVAQVTLESRQNGIVMAIAVAIGALLAKLVSWFIDRYRRRKSENLAEDTKKKLKELNTKLESIQVPAATFSEAEFAKTITDLQDKFNQNYTSFAETCLYAEPFVVETYSIQSDVFGTVMPKLLEFGDYYDRLMRSDQNAPALLSEVGTAVQYFKALVNRLTRSFSKTKLPNETPENLSQFMSALDNEARRLRNEPPIKTMVFEDFAKSVGLTEPFIQPKVINLPDARLRYEDSYVSRNMREMESLAKTLSKKTQPKSSDPTTIEGLQQFLKVFQGEVQAFFRYGALLDNMEKTEMDFYEMAFEYKKRRIAYMNELSTAS